MFNGNLLLFVFAGGFETFPSRPHYLLLVLFSTSVTDSLLFSKVNIQLAYHLSDDNLTIRFTYYIFLDVNFHLFYLG